MRQIQQVLRLKFANGCSNRFIANQCGIARSTVREYLYRAKQAGISWPLPEGMDDQQLEQRLFADVCSQNGQRLTPDWAQVHLEMKRKHMTLFLLWDEYKSGYAGGYQYSYFCHLYRQWQKCADVTMKQDHYAGEKMFIDYCGDTIPVIQSTTGEAIQAQIFVAVLGASNYTYAEATPSQSLKHWISSHERAFRYFGGVSAVLVPDNLRSAVTQAHRYEPLLNETYEEMAAHYQTCVVPARVRKPRDKSKAEGSVLLVERWILARLRNQVYHDFAQLNADIQYWLSKLNNKPFKKLSGSRASLFAEIEQAALKPLPDTPYAFAQWLKVRVPSNYHVDVESHCYSVPYTLCNRPLEVRLAEYTLEFFYKGKRVASHVRSYQTGGRTTALEHMPKHHRSYANCSPETLLSQAERIGTNTYVLIAHLLNSGLHWQQALRSCSGILRLQKYYDAQRLDLACRRAMAIDSCNCRSVESILKNNLEQQPVLQSATHTVQAAPMRGAIYYQCQQ